MVPMRISTLRKSSKGMRDGDDLSFKLRLHAARGNETLAGLLAILHQLCTEQRISCSAWATNNSRYSGRSGISRPRNGKSPSISTFFRSSRVPHPRSAGDDLEEISGSD